MATPIWTVRETWHWDQTFPAGRDLGVEHRYVPGVGGTAGAALASPEYRKATMGAQRAAPTIASTPISSPRSSGWPARRARAGRLSEERRSRYILTTGANWRSPIGDFRAGRRQGRSRRDRQLLRRRRAPDPPDPVRDPPPQLAAGPGPRRADRRRAAGMRRPAAAELPTRTELSPCTLKMLSFCSTGFAAS